MASPGSVAVSPHKRLPAHRLAYLKRLFARLLHQRLAQPNAEHRPWLGGLAERARTRRTPERMLITRPGYRYTNPQLDNLKEKLRRKIDNLKDKLRNVTSIHGKHAPRSTNNYQGYSVINPIC